jgi:transposase
MSEPITAFVGLDVHKDSIAIAIAEPGRSAPRFLGTTGPAVAELEKAPSHCGAPPQLLIVYEAGPCGYGLVRQLRASGYRCEVIAPTMIPRKPGDRVKTDRRDALALAHFARAGDLTPVFVPQEPDEAIRDLSRAREDAVRARVREAIRRGRSARCRGSGRRRFVRPCVPVVCRHRTQKKCNRPYECSHLVPL